MTEPQVLILAPTREIALQVQEECNRLTKGSVIVTLIAYGGVPVKKQAQKFSVSRFSYHLANGLDHLDIAVIIIYLCLFYITDGTSPATRPVVRIRRSQS